jgi:peptidoglycan L-alanyl-D-glutamate endopeptidase CwlK
MIFKLGNRSLEILQKAHPELQEVVKNAIVMTDVDFSVVETLRSREQQAENIRNNVSWSMDSDHLANADGVSRAVDIYPWRNGATSHDPEHYKRIAKAMFAAAQLHGIGIEWGGFWKAEHEDCPHWNLL